jgi:hypothetical protein
MFDPLPHLHQQKNILRADACEFTERELGTLVRSKYWPRRVCSKWRLLTLFARNFCRILHACQRHKARNIGQRWISVVWGHHLRLMLTLNERARGVLLPLRLLPPALLWSGMVTDRQRLVVCHSTTTWHMSLLVCLRGCTSRRDSWTREEVKDARVRLDTQGGALTSTRCVILPRVARVDDGDTGSEHAGRWAAHVRNALSLLSFSFEFRALV